MGLKGFLFGTAGKPLSMKNKPLVNAPSFLRKIGLDAMEYEAVRGVRISRENATRLGEEARKNGIVLSLHAPYYINLASRDEGVIERSIVRLIESVRAASWMGAWIVVFHPGYATGHPTRWEALRRIISSLREVSEKRNEINNYIWLGPEVAGGIKQIGGLEEIIEICRNTPRTRPVIDWAHLYARSRGTRPRSPGEVVDIIEMIEKELGTVYIKPLHMHYSTIEYGQGGEIRHHTMAEKYGPSFEVICRGLCLSGVEGIFISESPVLEEDSIKMRETCKQLC